VLSGSFTRKNLHTNIRVNAATFLCETLVSTRMNIDDWKIHINRCVENSMKSISKCSPEILVMDGMTGKKTRHLYNNLLDVSGARYLEVGVYTGSSLCSALYKNKVEYAYAVDNWSQFGGPKQEFLRNLKQFKGSNHVVFLESDFMKLDVELLPKFNIYMFDGGHEFQDHVNALSHVRDCLDDVFIYIVDDWNWKTVRNATFVAIDQCRYKILHGVEIKTTADDSHPSGSDCTDYYWNGCCVFLLQKV
jgi:hypothetical protein